MFAADESLSEEELGLYREALQQFYCDVFSEIKTSPLQPKSRKNLEQIYVHLLLLKDDKSREPVTYDKIFELLEGNSGKSRVAFLGQAGVGKTTFLAKMAYDWATGKHLKDIHLLFFYPLRDTHRTPCFNDIPRKYLNRIRHLDSRKVELYMRENQKKVMLLLDGLDEYSGDITQEDPADALIGVMRGDTLQQVPVIVTTRPWRAEQITSVDAINKQYDRVLVEGFKKEDVKLYITKFFEQDSESADSLIHLMTKDSLIAQNMAPYPIFCCMLCHVWSVESRRKAIQTLQTFSQLFDEMIDSLKDQWFSKADLLNSEKRANDSLKYIGDIAYRGLTNQQISTENEFKRSADSLVIGCEIGVLSSEKRFADHQTDVKQNISNVSFPHKLFEEYLAGLYLASMYGEDSARFAKLLKDTILPQYEEFRYLLYFAAAQGKRLGNAGKALMQSLCTEVKDDSFIVDVAFECHDELSIAPVTELFNQKEVVYLACLAVDRIKGYINIASQHTRSGCMYTLSVCCKNLVSRHAC